MNTYIIEVLNKFWRLNNMFIHIHTHDILTIYQAHFLHLHRDDLT